MSELMVGYDLILAISQNEINSQFERLVHAGYIKSAVQSNGLSSGGAFGGGAPRLDSYIRGPVSAPRVAFGTRNSSQEVEFSFTFVTRDWSPGDDSGWSLAELEAAFAAGHGATATDALLARTEDIPRRDSGGGAAAVLPQQTIHYWLRRKTVTVGTTASPRYSVVPALYYVSSGNPGLVSLEGLELRFAVQLNKIPARAEDFEDGVARGKLPRELLEAITKHKFNESVFSLEQLFLDFDTVDFTQWDLRDPAKGLGSTVSVVALGGQGGYTVRDGIKLAELTEQDPQLSTELSTNLQYVFGVKGENPAGRTPYILGVAVARSKPGPTIYPGPGSSVPASAAASLVPAWIGYSSNRNPDDAGLSTINYEVLGGKDQNVEARIPRNADKSIRHLATPLVSSNDFSGTLLFARSIFFDAYFAAPIQAALQSGAPWRQDKNVFSSMFHEQKQLDHERDVTDTVILGKYGYDADVTQEDTHTYTITVAGSRVTVEVHLHRRVQLKAKLYISYGDLDFQWRRDFTGSTQATFDVHVDQDAQLRFKVGEPAALQIAMTEDKSSLASAADKLLGALETIAMKNFNPAAQTLNELAAKASSSFQRHADALKQLAIQSSHTHFIPPTGQVFLLNHPRYNDELDLQMDVTYSV